MRTSSLSLTWLALAVASLAGALLTGCGGGGGGGGSSDTGQASVSLTDAPSDRLETFAAPASTSSSTARPESSTT